MRNDNLMAHRRGVLGGLTGRILLSFALVGVLAVAMMALFTNRATTHQFELYVSRGRQMRAERLAPYFAAYYDATGSWDGVEAMIDAVDDSVPTGGRGMGMRRGSQANMMPMMPAGSAVDRLILTDAEGRVAVDSGGELRGETLPQEILGSGVPLVVNGKPVGTLLAPDDVAHDSAQSEFLREVNETLVWVGLGSALFALALGFFLARRLTAPLRVLTEVAEQVAEGQPARQVAVRGADEIADLGRSFNRMAASLAEQEELRRNLMADIAHELRTPLAVIRSDLEALLDGIYMATPETLASLHDEALLLSRLIDDLRALSLAEAGQLQLKRERVSLRDVLTTEVTTFAPLAAARHIQLNWNPPADPLEAEVDAQRVKQVAANLLANALHHTPAGGHIEVSLREHAEQLEIIIADSGPGIAPDELPHIFDRFWRSDTAQPGEGSGLGLAIARSLVEAHGGRIWVSNRAEQGAEFHFTLPHR